MEGSQLVWFRDCSYKNKHLVGGKCSSLGELHNIAKRIGFSIGDGFALSITLYDRRHGDEHNREMAFSFVSGSCHA